MGEAVTNEMTTFVEVTVVLKFVFIVTLVVQVNVEVAVAVSVNSQTKGLDNVLVMAVGKREVNVTLPEFQRVIVSVVLVPPLTVIIVYGVEMVDVNVRVNSGNVNVVVITEAIGCLVVTVVVTLVMYVLVNVEVIKTVLVDETPPETLKDVIVLGTSTVPTDVFTKMEFVLVVIVFV